MPLGCPGRALASDRTEALTLAPLDVELTTRSAELMREYPSHPMDLAD
jgi:hypothetical protein